MDWTELDVHPRIISAVHKANIKSAKDLFTSSIGDLQKVTQLSIPDIYDLQKAASAALQKHSALTALQLYKEKTRFPSQHQKLGLGCGVLNNLLRGGLPLVGITELAGESSAGKTQIALQLCLSVQYPETKGGLGVGAVYICTEDAFPDKRLQQMIKSQHRLRTDVPADVVRKIRFGDHVFIEHAADIDMFTECITKKLPILLLRGQVRLIVIDSIAALFRCEFAAKDAVIKAKHLQTIGAKLHQLSRDFTTPVFCINQVTDAMKEGDSVLNHIGFQDRKVLPALGISWSNQLLMRLMVARTQREAPPPFIDCVLRTMEVIFAPHIPQATCYYTVDLEGVKGIGIQGL
ncbi:PREDICTED: DNA repair protein XRCC3 isoform X1 [Nanorana parkeri]|uniref:DNA repair protein XRCC3 isoform X1 n=1 Tax=Nanorana parkeri TaxID=125878 RepID=UPI0008549417|nr:PREDICTED: DNA repair protein XRCC3 isoform X1 [Nanorana parkeri]